MLATKILVALAASAAVLAQGGTMSVCVETCATAAAAANECTGIEDLPCICGNPQFAVDAQACVREHCASVADSAVAQQFFRATCQAAGITTTGTAGPAQTLDVTIPEESSSSPSPTPTSPPAETPTGGANSGSGNGNSALSNVAGAGAWTAGAVVMAVFGACVL